MREKVANVNCNNNIRQKNTFFIWASGRSATKRLPPLTILFKQIQMRKITLIK